MSKYLQAVMFILQYLLAIFAASKQVTKTTLFKNVTFAIGKYEKCCNKFKVMSRTVCNKCGEN